jgi:[ribosomal protein S5]-alanine N-acetyltransferase
MYIEISGDMVLSRVNKKDKSSLIRYLNDFDIYKNTSNIPHPYTSKDALRWINHVKVKASQTGRLSNFAIRDGNLNLIGGIGFHLKYGIKSHKDEIGYWLAKDFWNKGIMTKVVKKFCEIGFAENNLLRIEAVVFENNLASARVLEKNGFTKEGLLRKYLIKDNFPVNAFLYSLIKE